MLKQLIPILKEIWMEKRVLCEEREGELRKTVRKVLIKNRTFPC
jgi:hypothetical protein